jgi:hypothetical protein
MSWINKIGSGFEWLNDKITAPGRAIGHKIMGLGDESDSAIQKRDDLNAQGAAAGGFAGVGEAGFGRLGSAADKARQNLADIASGKISLSGEQLRQGLQQNLSAQRSLAAGANPQNAAMAARNASMNAARLGAGISGQTAMAGIAEREAAMKALQDAILQQRQQELQAALGSRQNAISAYGGVTPDKSWIEKWGPAIVGGIGAFK